jgi:hypothetical protein
MLRKCLALSSAFAFSVIVAHAQSEVDVSVGLGSAQDRSNGQSIDPLGTGTLSPTGAINGLFLKIGGDVMFKPSFGAGFETSFRPSQGSYAGLGDRPLFYDFNGIYKPALKSKRIVPELSAGVGGMNLKFYESQQLCNSLTGCSTNNAYLTSANHFQVHLGAGIRFYMTDHIFVRPEVDAHWVNNLSQFGSNWVPEYGMSIGYTLGER